MKALQTIITLSVLSSFSLHSMDKEYMGLETYHNQYVAHSSEIYKYHASWGLWKKKDPQNCKIINAYILLNRRPNESVEEQVEFYTQNLEAITKELNTFPSSQSYNFEKQQLQQKQSFLQAIIPQIEQANLSGKLQDPNLKQKVTKALYNIADYTGSDMHLIEEDDLKYAVENAQNCEFVINKNELARNNK